MTAIDLRYDWTRTRLRALGPFEVRHGRWSGRPTSLGELALRYDRLGTRLRSIGPHVVEYVDGNPAPVVLGEWRVVYDADRLVSVGRCKCRYDGAVMRSIGPVVLHYDGSHHPQRVERTDGGAELEQAMAVVLYFVIERRDYRTDLRD